jgi:hypothetical protein
MHDARFFAENLNSWLLFPWQRVPHFESCRAGVILKGGKVTGTPAKQCRTILLLLVLPNTTATKHEELRAFTSANKECLPLIIGIDRSS